MTRKFTFLILAMLFAILGSGAEAWGQTTYTMQSYNDKVITSDNNATWSVSNACAGSELPYQLNSKRGAGFQSNNTVTSSFSVTNASKITVIASANENNTTTLTVKVGGTQFGSTISVSKGNYQTLEFSVPNNSTASGNIEFTITRTSRTLWIGQVIVETASAPSAELVSIAISGTPKTAYETGESFDVTGLVVTGTYSNATTADLTNDAEWTIDPATFTSTSQNSVSVTATVDGKTDTKNYSVIVTEHIVTPGTYTISLNNALYGISTGNNGTEQSATVNDITVISGCSSNAQNKTYYDTDHIRYYENSYLKLAVSEGYLITSVVFTSDGTWNGSTGISVNTGSYSDTDNKTWTGNAQEVDFSFSKQCRAASITVTYIRNKTLDHISVAGTQTSFFVGDEFKHDEMTVTAHYDDGTSENVTSLATFSTPDMTTAGVKTVTVTYNNKKTSYTITVQAVVLTSVVVSGEPTKKEYYVGESFNPAGLTVTGTYNNGTQATITEGITWTITPETFTYITETSVTVKATVGDVTSADFEVTGLTVTSPESAYTLTAQPAEGGSYTVTVGDDPAQTVTTEAIEFKVTEGTLIQVEATADDHYQLNSSTPFVGNYSDEGSTKIEFSANGSGNKKKFTYGTADATITAKFIRMYAVNIDENIEHGTVEADKSEATPGTGITLTLTPDAHYHFKSVTVVDKTGEDIILSENPTTSEGITTAKFKMPSAEAKKGDVSVTATFAEDAKYTITFSVNGENTPSTDYAGEQVEFPEVSPIGDYTFVGWTATPITSVQPQEPPLVKTATYPENNTTVYYAVFAEKEGDGGYVKVTSVDDGLYLDGLYLIVNEASSRAFNGLDAANDYVDVTISNGKITDDNGAAIIEIAAMTGGYSLKITNGDKADSYIYGKSGSNSIQYGATAVASTISFTNGAAKIENNSTYFCYNSQSGNDRFRFYKNTTTGDGYIVPALYKKQEATYSNYCTTVEPIVISENTIWNSNVTINGSTIVTIGSGAVLTVNGTLTNDNPANLVIEDGGQLIVNNSGVKATMKKNIGSNTSKASDVNWYTISSPLAVENTAFADVTNLIPNNVTGIDYDLYRFDEANGMWINSRIYNTDGTTIIANPDFTTIDKGGGYIYHNNADSKLEFKGEINVNNVSGVSLTLTANKGKGYNLIGNPFTQNIKLTDVTGVTLADGFYVLTNQNTWGAKIETGSIAPLQGFLVQVTETGNATISKPTAPSKGERSNEQSTNIEIIVSNSSYTDNAYAMFGEGTGLNKVSHRNTQAPMLYVPQDGEDFAIAFMDENTTIFPVSFKAMTTGNYSISLNATDDIRSLVLVDNMTGVETNMLLEDSYTFIGSPADNDNRFTVKLKISNSQDEDEHFAYQNGNELVVNGEGTLQIFDVLGRVVVSEEVNGQSVSVGGLNTGAYIVRLTGESVKTQKIVVR